MCPSVCPGSGISRISASLPGQDAHAVESEPLVAADVVLDPAGTVGPVRGDVARALAPARVHRGIELGAEHVDLGVGKVRQASRVVEVEMRRDDVAHVARLEAELADLGDGRLGGVGARARDRGERNAELARVAGVVEAEAGVDQHEPLGALDEQAVADEPCAREQAALAGDQARPAGTSCRS